MSNIDFTPTAYTVTTPGSGKPGRYEGEVLLIESRCGA